MRAQRLRLGALITVGPVEQPVVHLLGNTTTGDLDLEAPCLLVLTMPASVSTPDRVSM